MRATIFIFILFISIISCNRKENELEVALTNAKENRVELEKTLDFYSKNPSDSLKYMAACFLIKNMPWHFSYDSTYLHKYRPVIEKINSLKTNGHSENFIKEQVNPLMDSLIAIYPLSNVYSVREKDLTSIKSELLINNIELAFESYNNNPFKDSIIYDDFLEYVLPYRIQNGYCLEDWRLHFIQNYLDRTKGEFLSVHEFCDSLLSVFDNIEIAWSVADKYPYLKLSDYLKSQMTNCPQKCWFNCLLLRSFGVPVTIDFVPASRVHELGHEWNSLKLKSGTYPFDPFWVGYGDIRYLKSYYSREKLHPKIGSIQFPKVYRKTFTANISKLLEHAINTGESVPPFFQNPFQKDVTEEYFETFEIESSIIKKIKGADYLYACVMGSRTWEPVDFGKVKKGKASFKSLGSRNVYLPSYYKFNNFIPAAYPILLNEKGNPLILCPDKSHTRKIEIPYVAFPRPSLDEFKKSFIGTTIEGANNKDFNNKEVLYRINKSYEPGTYRIQMQTNSKFRFVRITIPNIRTILNEIKFFTIENGVEKEIRGEFITSYPEDNLSLYKIVDGDILTRFNFFYLRKKQKLQNFSWVGYDFKHPVSIDTFEFSFVFNANIRRDGVYELLYWDFGWKSLGIKKASSPSKPLIFDNVPENALLMIKIHDTEAQSRIFTYSEGKQHWW